MDLLVLGEELEFLLEGGHLLSQDGEDVLLFYCVVHCEVIYMGTVR